MTVGNLRGLEALMPAPRRGGDGIDWDELEADLGVAFPSDYRGFVEMYGGGSVDDTLYVIPLARRLDSWRQEYVNADQNLFHGDIEVELDIAALGCGPIPGLLVPWGITPSADVAYWLASTKSPDEWPVAVYRNRQSPAWIRFDMGFSQFLRSVISGELESPFGVKFPASVGCADYLSWKDEEMLAESGVFVSGYIHHPQEFFSEVADAGFDPLGLFPSAARLGEGGHLGWRRSEDA